ncbi:hypothetical protein Tc00.1047053511669.20 [Trypanosoma cruzi]|uniref:Uncharacterized protein n=1 Tax=Trypanosoma cruzi (strain CL Brener) TaxID=353153 RepID=Q4CRD3_TRYCC|nr:hypothetical protein Tc00.1047053511669.20 [Trypanosoma cruzi]EAN82836.1 hypothetical protein Tc00.1047053511669.20 [Trypanosoma cruzi]|eukprot:XP_804687.1 hypothetical protein [Trypanosoma cruzi strain CL Brener]
MNGCRHDALTINMAREHAATPRRNTAGKGERGKARSSTTHTEETNCGKSIALAGNSTPALTHTYHHSAASPRVRRFGPPQNKRTQRQQSNTNGQERGGTTHRHHLQFNPTDNGIQPQPRSQHNAHGASNHPKSHTQKRILIHP